MKRWLTDMLLALIVALNTRRDPVLGGMLRALGDRYAWASMPCPLCTPEQQSCCGDPVCQLND